ncbi:hypothetical protein [Arthrobacter sp. NA-172]
MEDARRKGRKLVEMMTEIDSVGQRLALLNRAAAVDLSVVL